MSSHAWDDDNDDQYDDTDNDDLFENDDDAFGFGRPGPGGHPPRPHRMELEEMPDSCDGYFL